MIYIKHQMFNVFEKLENRRTYYEHSRVETDGKSSAYGRG